MAEDIIIRYRAETDELTKELNLIIEQQEKLEQSAADTSKGVQKAVSVETTALKQRQQLIEKELQTIGKLEAARKRASDPKVVEKFNAAIAQSERNIRSLKSVTEKAGADITATFNKAGSQIKNIGLGIAAGFGAAFSVDAVVNFARQSVTAFLSAQEEAQKLEFAIVNIGGESQEAVERLTRQAEELQKITFFDDDDIKAAQAALSAFGLTADQIEEVIPKLLDFSVVSGTDLTSAVQQVGTALEGTSREFKKYGAELDPAATKSENLAEVNRILARQAGAASAALETEAGKIKDLGDSVEEVKESFGEILTKGTLEGFKTIGAVFSQLGESIARFLRSLGLISDASGKTEQATSALQTVFNGIAFAIEKVNQLTIFYIDTLTKGIQGVKAFAASFIFAFQEIGNVVSKVGSGIAQTIDGIFDFDSTKIKAGIDNIKKPLSQFGTDIAKTFNDTFDSLNRTVQAQKEETTQAIKSNEVLLTSLEIRKKSTQELTKLIEDLKQVNSNAARQNIEAIQKELEARKKAADEDRKIAEKAAAEAEARRQKELAEIEKQFQAAQTAQEKFIKDLEAKQKEIDSLLEFQVQITLNNEGADKALDTLRTELRKRYDEEAAFIDKNAQIDGESAEVTAARKLKAYQDFADQFKRIAESLGLFTEQENEVEVASWIDRNTEILNSVSQLYSQLTALSNTFTQGRIQDLEAQLTKADETATAEQDALDESLNRRLISEDEYRKKSDAIAARRVENEKKIQAQINKEKKKQATLDKIAAIFEIAIQTAINITKAFPNPVIMALAAALGALQTATVAATPIPAYKKGTKNAKGGMSRVGEEGEEIMFVPSGAKILPHKQTKTYGEVFDAMQDNKFESYIKQKFVTPALLEQKKKFEQQKQESFATNIVNSMQYNGITANDMVWANKKGVTIRDKAELADMIGKAVHSYQNRPDLWRM